MYTCQQMIFDKQDTGMVFHQYVVSSVLLIPRDDQNFCCSKDNNVKPYFFYYFFYSENQKFKVSIMNNNKIS